MNSWTIIAIAALTCRSFGITDRLPSDIPKCRYGDSKCLVQSVQYTIDKYVRTGIPGLNLRPLDQLLANSIFLGRNPYSPLSVDLSLRDVVMEGFSNTKVLSLRGFERDIRINTVVELQIPRIVVRGKYELNGHMLLLPITGKGDAEIVLEDSYIRATMIAEPVEKSGRIFMHTNDVEIFKQPKSVRYNFTNLFNGNNILANAVLSLMNQNDLLVYGELGPELEKAKSLVFVQILNEIFASMPYADFFLDN